MNLKDSVKDNILDAVLKHISETGRHQVTIREIGKLANVNSAAISYYFGSKDELIRQACMRYYDMGSELFLELGNKNSSPRERLKSFFMSYTNHMFKYPGFLKAQLSQFININGIGPEVEKWLTDNLNLLAGTIGEATGEKDHDINYYKAMQLLSNMVYPFLLSQSGFNPRGISLSDEAVRKKYIDTMLDGMLLRRD